jgi:transposase
MIYVGLDLHKRYITGCAIDAEGQLVAEERRLPTEWLGRRTGAVTVVLEATLYWAWLAQQLTALGYTVQVAHPYQVKLIWAGARRLRGPRPQHAQLQRQNASWLRGPRQSLA